MLPIRYYERGGRECECSVKPRLGEIKGGLQRTNERKEGRGERVKGK